MRRNLAKNYPASRSAMGSVEISIFRGVFQGIDDEDMSMQYSRNAINCDVSAGMLKSLTGHIPHPQMGAPAGFTIEELMVFFSSTIAPVVLATSATDIYKWTGTAWVSIKGTNPVTNGAYSYINYQTSDQDIIVMTNGADNVYKWGGTGNIGALTPSSPYAPRGADITLRAERVWMAVFSGSEQNTIYWSDDLVPGNWTVATDAAGAMVKPTWDGDKITAIANIFGDVVFFKLKSASKILGTYPTEFQQVPIHTTSGCVAPRSICEHTLAAFFLSPEGIMTYDGTSCKLLGGNALKDIYRQMDHAYDKNARGIVVGNRMYMAVTMNGSTINNTVIEYDIIDGTFAVRTETFVKSWVFVNNQLLFTDGSRVYVYGGADVATSNVGFYWDTPTNDLGAADAMKRLERVYVTGRGGDVEIDCLAEGIDGPYSESVVLTLPAATDVVTMDLSTAARRFAFRIIAKAPGVEINKVHVTFERDDD